MAAASAQAGSLLTNKAARGHPVSDSRGLRLAARQTNQGSHKPLID